MPHKKFREQTIVITGAGSSIGTATALAFAKEGANVVLVGRQKEKLIEIAEMIPEEDESWIHHDNHMTITCDISNPEQVAKMVSAIKERFEHIDVLVNDMGNAIQDKPVQEAVANVSQAMIPQLIASKGSIVNVCSLFTLTDNSENISKLTKTMAVEHGADGVRVNSVSAIGASIGASNEEEIQQLLAKSPLQSVVTPEDIASAILFLASDEASMITGVDLTVDGGITLNG